MTTILTGVLSLALGLGTVAETRSDPAATAYPVTRDPAQYRCLLGVRHGYAWLIDQEVYVITDDGGIYGPYLVTDVEADVHAKLPGAMAKNGLAADTDCEYLIHRRARIMMRDRDFMALEREFLQ